MKFPRIALTAVDESGVIAEVGAAETKAGRRQQQAAELDRARSLRSASGLTGQG